MSEHGSGSVTILLEQLPGCDPERFTEIWETLWGRFEAQLFPISKRTLHMDSRVVVSDATIMSPVDDAIVEILRNIQAGKTEVRDRQEIKGFLAHRVKSRALDRLREKVREANRRSPSGLPEDDCLDDGTPMPVDQVIRAEMIEGLMARLVGLAPRYSLILRGLLEGRPIPEIMEQSGRTRPSFYRDLQEVRKIAGAYLHEVYEIKVQP